MSMELTLEQSKTVHILLAAFLRYDEMCRESDPGADRQLKRVARLKDRVIDALGGQGPLWWAAWEYVQARRAWHREVAP